MRIKFHYHKKSHWLLLIGILILLLPGSLAVSERIFGSNKATLYFVAPNQQPYITSTFPIEIKVNSPKVAINAIELKLKYNPNVLEILTMSADQSFCSFYVDNRFDNIKGEVDISCGKPSPGFVGESTVVRLTVRGKTISPTTVTMDAVETRVLANDGKGTNILKETSEATYTIRSSF